MFIFFVLYSGEDESVIYKLFKENNLFLYNVAKNILGNKDDAEDVVQETFCRVSVNIDKIRKLQEEKRIAYAVVMVKNLSFNIINAKKRETCAIGYKVILFWKISTRVDSLYLADV